MLRTERMLYPQEFSALTVKRYLSYLVLFGEF